MSNQPYPHPGARRFRFFLTRLRGHPQRVVARPLCAKCGQSATLVELVPPRQLPHDSRTWPKNLRSLYRKYPGRNANWHFIFKGIEVGNGIGDDIDTADAVRIAGAFAEPPTLRQYRTQSFPG
jgi:hypothetical protein